MNVAIYARYSPGPKQTDQSIEGQVRDCEAYAKAHGLKVVKIYADRHISGSDFVKRVEFNRMLEDSEKGKFKAIIVWKLDRFGRNREEIALNKIKLKKNGVKLLYAMESIPDGPEGIILESLMEGLAEYYVADLTQKLKRGARESALKGRAVAGTKVFGYDLDADKHYIINEKEAVYVKWIFEQYVSGKGSTYIVNELRKKGVRNKRGSLMTYNGVYTILRNEKYIGKCFYDGIPIPIPRIISDELFTAASTLFQSKPHCSGTGKAIVKYLLSMKAYCGECGGLLIGESGRGKCGSKYFYYKCSNKKRKHNCDLPNWKKDELEKLVAKITKAVVLRSDVIEYIADKVIEIKDEVLKNPELEAMRVSLKNLQRAQKNLLKAVEDGLYTSATKDRLIELEEEIADVKASIAQEEVNVPNITRDHIIYWLEQFRSGDITDEAFLDTLFETFIHSIHVYKDKIVVAYNYANNHHFGPVDFSDIPELSNVLTGSDLVGGVDLRGVYPNFFVLAHPPVFLLVASAA